MLPNVGMGELVVILVIVLVLFGSKRLPEVAKGLGRSVKAFKEGLEEGTTTTDVKKEIESTESKPS